MKGPGRMVLPFVDPASGAVARDAVLGDERVPARMPDGDGPRLLAADRCGEPCPTGRHLWDALIATAWDESLRAEGDEGSERYRFRLRLTCVRCGHLEALAGVLVPECGDRGGRVDPVPLRCGPLLAQQVNGDASGHELTTWTVHDRDAGPPIGVIAWGMTRRQRRYFQGRLHTWPAGTTVQAPTPSACLRKLVSADSPSRPASGVGGAA